VPENMESLMRFRVGSSSVLNQIMEELLALEISEATALSTQKLEGSYFDTENRDLQKVGFGYQISRENHQWMAKVTFCNPSERLNYSQKQQEWKIKIEEPIPDINYFSEILIGASLKNAAFNKELKPLFKTSFERKKMNLLFENDSWIEITGDIGKITVNDLEEPLSELNLKLKTGCMSDLLKLGSNLIERYALFINNKSQYHQGLVLAGFSDGKEKKIKLKLTSNEKITGAIVKIVINNIYEIINAQENLLAQMEEPENVHQLRVKLRQLRALFSFASPLFNQNGYHEKQEQLGKIGLEFSTIREVDVILEELEKIIETSVIPLGDFPLLKNELEKKRKEELKRVASFLKTNQLSVILLDLWTWLLKDSWSDSEILELSLKDYTEQQLGIWLKRINKAMGKMELAHKEDIHKVRIKSKKLRYVMEQLSTILDSDSKKSIKKFEKLQGDLGYFHDVYINKLLLEKLIDERDSDKLNYEAGLFIGWQTNQGNIKMRQYF